jgi:parallel beta-helix repeat protein
MTGPERQEKVMRVSGLVCGIMFSWLCVQGARADDVACDADKVSEVLEDASDEAQTVEIDCNLTLQSTHVITKGLVIRGARGSNITIDCNGARLDGTGNTAVPTVRIASKAPNYETCQRDESGSHCPYDPVENVTFRDCDIHGRVNIRGVRPDEYPTITRRADYTEVVRAEAPKNIRFEHVTSTSDDEIAFYVYPGVSGFQLVDSTLNGTSDEVVIYLDAESTGHLIKNNRFNVNTSRELIAVDGSSHNRILDNRFTYTSNGGIFLYRNCGESSGQHLRGTGSIRHATPSHNLIVNNRFSNGDYNDGSYPNVWIGSRNGNRTYCDADLQTDGKPYPWGSSISNLDHATDNIVMQNQITNGTVSKMFTGHDQETDVRNIVSRNERVSTWVDRKAGCYLPTGFTTDFLLDGQSAAVVKSEDGQAACANVRCSDGDLIEVSACAMYTADFACGDSGNDQGCNRFEACPLVQSRQTTAFGAKAACDLEHESVTASELATVPPGRIDVVVPSTNVADGSCYAAATKISQGYETIRGGSNQAGVRFGCHESDSNGGDCEIRGVLYCK